MEYQHVTHESIPPYINKDSNILILGSLPSIKSREYGFFYAHPQNRFFKTIAHIFNEEEPKTIDDRKSFLKRHNIALYDVIYECDIVGSSDSSIKNVVPIGLSKILKEYPSIKRIYTTGKKAKDLYDKYLLPQTGIEAIPLPSSSGANATISQIELEKHYKIILKK